MKGCQVVLFMVLSFGSASSVFAQVDTLQHVIEMFEYTVDHPYQRGIVAGEYFPKQDFVDIDGNRFSFYDDHYDLTVVNFWSPDCKSCMEEKPNLKKMKAHYEDRKRIRFVSIVPGSPEKVKRVLSKHGDPEYQIIPVKTYKEREKLFKFKGNPRQSLVTKDGEVLAQYLTGIFTKYHLEEFIKRTDQFFRERTALVNSL